MCACPDLNLCFLDSAALTTDMINTYENEVYFFSQLFLSITDNEKILILGVRRKGEVGRAFLEDEIPMYFF